MHIKNIHSMIEKLSECAKCELDKGIEKIDTEEMSKVAEIIKELAEAEYYASVTKAMEEHDFEDEEEIEDEGRKGYRGRRRDSRGRFMSNRGRRGYESPMMMYDEEWDEMERMRDMDRPMGRMSYSGSGSSMGGSQGQSSSGMIGGSMSSQGGSQGGSRGYSESGRDRREGRSGQSRRGYMEAKEKGADKQQKMKELEDYMKSMAEDLTEAIEGATPEERAMAKNKLSVLVQKM